MDAVNDLLVEDLKKKIHIILSSAQEGAIAQSERDTVAGFRSLVTGLTPPPQSRLYCEDSEGPLQSFSVILGLL